MFVIQIVFFLYKFDFPNCWNNPLFIQVSQLGFELFDDRPNLYDF